MDLEYFPVQDVAPILMEMLEANMVTKAFDDSESASDEIFTVESLHIYLCKEVGLSVDELQHITLSMALDCRRTTSISVILTNNRKLRHEELRRTILIISKVL